MRNNAEYQLCKAVATYLRMQYPKVIYHFDLAGLNLSKAQAGRMKAIQGQRGYPDLFIAESSGGYHGLFLELKAEGTKLAKKNGEYATPHIAEQAEMLIKLLRIGYDASFAVGFNEAKIFIDDYLELTKYQNK